MQRQEQDLEQKLLAARTSLELVDKEIKQASPGESLYAASFKTYPDLKKIYPLRLMAQERLIEREEHLEQIRSFEHGKLKGSSNQREKPKVRKK